MNCEEAVKILLSPVLRAARRLHDYHHGYYEEYESYEAALRQTIGYEAESVIKNASVKAARFVQDIQKDEASLDELSRDLIAAFGIANLDIQAGSGTPLRVLDWGGALGKYYYVFRRFFPDDVSLAWTVLETPSMADEGQRSFQTEELRFVSDPALLPGVGPFDIILASGVIQCLDRPEQRFADLCELNHRFFLVNRFPAAGFDRDRITLFTVPRRKYKLPHPVWFFSEKKWMSLFEKEHNLIARWRVPREAAVLGGKRIEYQGFLFKSRVRALAD